MKGKGAEGAQECAVRVLLGKAQQSSSRERDRKGYAKEPRRRLERGVSDGAARDGVHHDVKTRPHGNLHTGKQTVTVDAQAVAKGKAVAKVVAKAVFTIE